MIPARTTLTWRAFEDIASNAEAACASASCTFSLSTLQMAAPDHAPRFAITERKLPDMWRWAVIGMGGGVLEEGFEPTECQAKQSASDALRLLTSELA